MDVLSLVCPLMESDQPQRMSLVSSRCGYYHNSVPVSPGIFGSNMASKSRVGLCVRPESPHFPNDVKRAKHVAEWLEYYRSMGADRIYVYTPFKSSGPQKVFDTYQEMNRSFLVAKDWTIMGEKFESSVYSEAAVNDCILRATTMHTYVLIVSLDQWISIKREHDSLNELLDTGVLREKLNKYGGLRISNTAGEKPAILLDPSHILGSAANHLIPFDRRPSFRVLDQRDVVALHFYQRDLSWHFTRRIDDIAKAVEQSMARMGEE